MSQNQVEGFWLGKALEALPHGAQVVVRIGWGTVVTDGGGRRMRLGERRWLPQVRYGLHHGRPRDLWLNVLGVWEPGPLPGAGKGGKAPEEPWYLAANLGRPGQALRGYRLRGWIERRLRDSKGASLACSGCA